MADRFTEYMLTLMSQVGGGRGGPENELVRFGLGVLLWGALLVFALKRRREDDAPHETLLAWGFGLGLLLEAMMFAVYSLEVAGAIGLAALRPYFPPLERALRLAGLAAVTAGFLRAALGARRAGGPRYLAAGTGGAAVLYGVTAVLWPRHLAAFPGADFDTTWFAWVFSLAAAGLLGWTFALLTRLSGWARTTLLAAMGCFFLDEVLLLASLALGARSTTIGPARHLLHLAGIFLLVSLYLRYLTAERNAALRDLQTVVNLTAGERLRTEAILDSIGDAVSVQDSGFRVLYQNRVHRLRRGNHLGEICHEAYAGSPVPCPGCPLVLAFADGGVHRIERPRVLADGRGEVLEITASSVCDDAGRIVAGIEVARDVTARVTVADELRRAKEGLERQNAELRKLDVLKDGLIRDVTHEFKTPVAKHAMQLEILRRIVREQGVESHTRRVLDVMAGSITRQQRMIKNILDLARLEAGGRRYQLLPLRLDEVVGEVLEDSACALEAHAVSVSCDAPPLALNSDREMLHCLLSNLVDNAIKYRLPGVAAWVAVSLAVEDGQAVVRVSDNGVGFDARHLDHAFERFWQASASAEGSGVGLTICRMIAEDLGGSIAIVSPGVGKGTTVTVRLPGDAAAVASRRAAQGESDAGRIGATHPWPHAPRQHPGAGPVSHPALYQDS